MIKREDIPKLTPEQAADELVFMEFEKALKSEKRSYSKICVLTPRKSPQKQKTQATSTKLLPVTSIMVSIRYQVLCVKLGQPMGKES